MRGDGRARRQQQRGAAERGRFDERSRRLRGAGASCHDKSRGRQPTPGFDRPRECLRVFFKNMNDPRPQVSVSRERSAK